MGKCQGLGLVLGRGSVTLLFRPAYVANAAHHHPARRFLPSGARRPGGALSFLPRTVYDEVAVFFTSCRLYALNSSTGRRLLQPFMQCGCTGTYLV